MNATAGDPSGTARRRWLVTAAVGLLVALISLGFYAYATFSSDGRGRVDMRFDSAGRFYAVDEADARSTGRCEITPDGGTPTTVTLPAGYFRERLTGDLIKVSGPAAVTCSGTDLFVLRGIPAWVAWVNYKNFIGFLGLVFFSIALDRLRRLRSPRAVR